MPDREPPDRDAVARQQAAVARILMAADPVAALRAHAAQPGADPCFATIDEDGLRIAALLVVKLRFQRLTNASRQANEWFERDPRGFAAAFRRYHQEVPPTAFDPWREAQQFAEWSGLAD